MRAAFSHRPYSALNDSFQGDSDSLSRVGSTRGPVCSMYEAPPGGLGILNLTPPRPPIPEGWVPLKVDAAAFVITSAQLEGMLGHSVTPSLTEAINLGMAEGGIKSSLAAAMFIAQVAHESEGFKHLYEVGGKTVYNSRTKTRKSYKQYSAQKTKDPDDKVYDYFEFMYDPDTPDDGRKKVAKKLGNTQKGDGARYRGRGYIQLTGRSNYKEAGEALGLDLENNPDLAADPLVAGRIAGWFWKTRRINRFTNSDTEHNFKKVTRIINGGENGLADRKRRFKQAKEALLREREMPGFQLH